MIIVTQVPKVSASTWRNLGIRGVRKKTSLANRDRLSARGFCGNDDTLIQRYRCYGNPYDRIHLGRVGIELLKDILVSRISKVDTRSYSTVLQTGHAQNHRT